LFSTTTSHQRWHCLRPRARPHSQRHPQISQRRLITPQYYPDLSQRLRCSTRPWVEHTIPESNLSMSAGSLFGIRPTRTRMVPVFVGDDPASLRNQTHFISRSLMISKMYVTLNRRNSLFFLFLMVIRCTRVLRQKKCCRSDGGRMRNTRYVVPSDQSPPLFHRIAHSMGTCRTHTRGVKAWMRLPHR
jgi:hypothetical protein